MFNDYIYLTPIEMEEISKDLIDNLVKDISSTPIYSYLRSKVANETFGRNELNIEINQLIENHKTNYPIQYTLFKENEYYRNAVQESVFLYCYYDVINPKQDYPFIESSIERSNYLLLESIASPVLKNDAYYMKFSAPHFDDLNIENIGENRIAISHYYELNGDMMADPDVECIIDNENKLLIPMTYQQDNLQIFYDIDSRPDMANSLNSFMHDWLTNIKENRFKINEIKTDEIDYKVGKDSYKKIYLFCKQHNIEHMLAKPKEKSRCER